jgi:two-component system, cell cycle sensor histidine kinase and response regulator CckA
MNSELESARQSRLYEMLSRVNQTIVRARTREELLPKVCQIVVEVGGFTTAWIGWLDTASNVLAIAAKAGDNTGLVTDEFISDHCCGLEVLESGQARAVNELFGSPCTAGCLPIAEKLRLRACATYPIRLKSRISGVLVVGKNETYSLNAGDFILLEEVALDISYALDNLETERQSREAESVLKRSERYLETVLENALDGFYLVDMGGRLLDVNEAYCAMSGYSRTELLQMRIANVESAESEHEIAEHIQRVKSKGSDRFASRHRRKDGKIIDIETSVRFRDVDGGRLFCFLRDVTESKRAEQALRESEERFRSVVEGAPVSILIQADGIYRYMNAAAVTMFGGETAGQLVGHPVAERIHPDSRAAVKERIRMLKEGSLAVPFIEEQLLRLDGSAIDVEVSAKRFIFEEREGSIVFVRDITERKREEKRRQALEQQLLQAQKMEAVGRLAGGIAHDFNNLLMVIRSYSELLQDSLPADDILRRNTEGIMKASDRAASLIGQMLVFSRKQIGSPVLLDLNGVVNETAKMLKRLIGEDIEFQVNATKSLWAIEADSDQIVQVLMNLCVNARDAMPQGGMLTIATGNVTVREGGVGGQPYVLPGDYVRLSVIDTGTGISKELQDQIFEPFFTTKEVGKGTGLGLATVYGIVKQSGGYLWVDSELGLGASFKIYFPRVRKPVAEITAELEPQPRGTETLLLAEDEEALREAMCDNLRALGYTVLAGSSGQEALSVAVGHEGPINLLITDVVMPRMSGRELSQILGSLRPEMKTIYMSGYTDDAVLRHGVQELGASLLQKPFSLSTLARKVREMLQ